MQNEGWMYRIYTCCTEKRWDELPPPQPTTKMRQTTRDFCAHIQVELNPPFRNLFSPKLKWCNCSPVPSIRKTSLLLLVFGRSETALAILLYGS